MLELKKGISSAQAKRGQLTILYGRAGTGKTTLAAKSSIGKGFVLQVGENGLSDLSITNKWTQEVLEYPKVLGMNNRYSEDYDEFKTLLKTLYTAQKRDYDVIVIDGFGNLINTVIYNHLIINEFKGNKSKAESYNGIGKFLYSEVNSIFKMMDLLQQKGYNIVCTMHSTLANSKDFAEDGFKIYTPDTNASIRPLILASVTNLLCVIIMTEAYEIYQTEYEGRGINDAQKRIICIQPTRGWDAKSRVTDKAFIDLDVKTFEENFITICPK